MRPPRRRGNECHLTTRWSGPWTIVGRTLVANRLLAGSACGKRRCARPLNSVVRAHVTLWRKAASSQIHAPLRRLRYAARFSSSACVNVTSSPHAPQRLGLTLPIESKYAESPWHLSGALPARVVSIASACGIICNMARVKHMRPNKALERTVKHRGPRLAAARAAWSAAQRVR